MESLLTSLTERDIALSGLALGIIATIAAVLSVAVGLIALRPSRHTNAKKSAGAKFSCTLFHDLEPSRVFVVRGKEDDLFPLLLKVSNHSLQDINDVQIVLGAPGGFVRKGFAHYATAVGTWIGPSDLSVDVRRSPAADSISVKLPSLPAQANETIYFYLTLGLVSPNNDPYTATKADYPVTLSWRSEGVAAETKEFDLRIVNGSIETSKGAIDATNDVAASTKHLRSTTVALALHVIRYFFSSRYRKSIEPVRVALFYAKSSKSVARKFSIAHGLYSPISKSYWIASLGTTFFDFGTTIALPADEGETA